MNMLKELHQNYKKFKTAHEEATADTSAAGIYHASKLEPQMKAAYKDLKLAIMAELRATNEFYQKIHEQNLKLLYNKGFMLEVTKVKTARESFAKFSTRFEGGIMSNGYLYFRSVETNGEVTIQSYASYLTGTLDEHGIGEINYTDTEIRLLQTLPSLYKGKIGADGTIYMEVLELDLTLESSDIAFEIVGDPFNRHEKKRQLFLRNRSEMNRLIAEKITELEKP